MATRVDEAFELIDEKSLSITIGTPQGLEKVEKSIIDALKQRPIEDDFSAITSIDFSTTKEVLKQKHHFSISDVYVNSILKLKLDERKIKGINRTIRNTVTPFGIDYFPISGVVNDGEYLVPLLELEDDNEEQDNYLVVGYISFEQKNGEYVLPTIGEYTAPIVKFNYFNKDLGKTIIRDLYGALSDMDLNEPVVKRIKFKD